MTCPRNPHHLTESPIEEMEPLILKGMRGEFIEAETCPKKPCSRSRIVEFIPVDHSLKYSEHEVSLPPLSAVLCYRGPQLYPSSSVGVCPLLPGGEESSASGS